MQFLSVHPSEKLPLQELLADSENMAKCPADYNHLLLWQLKPDIREKASMAL